VPTGIDRGSLGPMTKIGEGGYGTVSRLDRFRLPGYGQLAYKEFLAPTAADLANLEDLLQFHQNLTTQRRALLDDGAAWPLRRVTDNGGVIGFVMPLVPKGFFFQQKLPSGAVSRELLTSQWLVSSTAKARGAGVGVPAADDLPARLVLCAKLAHVLGVLHRDGLVYGDVSLNNALFAPGPPGRIMVIDCDAATRVGTGYQQANTPDWVPPEISGGTRSHQDLATDRYKLALFVLRCLSPGDHASQAVDPERMVGILDDPGVRLMRAGVSGNRAARPTAKQWYAYLTDYLGDLTEPPVISMLTVDRQLALAGDWVTVEWSVRGASSGVLRTPDGAAITVDISARSARVVVRHEGAVTLTVENGYGERSASTDPIYLFRPPRIESVTVPGPELPTAEVGAQQDLAAALRQFAAGSVAGPSIELPLPDPAVGQLAFPDLTRLVPPAPIGGALPGSAAMTAMTASIEAAAVSIVDVLSSSSAAAASAARATQSTRP
jgi:hypothetical protein